MVRGPSGESVFALLFLGYLKFFLSAYIEEDPETIVPGSFSFLHFER
jgi:hypothetical protein